MIYRVFYLLIIALCTSLRLSAQQRPHYTQYNVNNYTLNPAVGGIGSGIDVKTGYRTQWVGFESAPKTFFASAHAPLNKISNIHYRRRRVRAHHGAGGYVFNDVTGPLSRQGVYGSYAYHLPLNKELFFSAGVFLGVVENKLDLDKITLSNPNDPAVLAATGSKLSPDGALGLWLYSERFFAGLSMSQIFRSKIYTVNDNSALLEGKLYNHYFLHLGYNIRIPFKENWKIVPSVLIKSVRPTYSHFDLNLKVWYANTMWGAVTYRFQDAISAMVGYKLQNWLEVSYSYDLTTSEIRRYSSGSHEIIIGLSIPTRLNILCPDKFW